MTPPAATLHIAWDDTERAWLVLRRAGPVTETVAIRSLHAEAVAVMEAATLGLHTRNRRT